MLACRDVPTAPPEYVPTEPDYITIVVDAQFNADYDRAIRYPALVLSGTTTLNLLYGMQEAGDLRYAGCPAACGNRQYWWVGNADTSAGYFGRYLSAAVGGSGVHVAFHAWRPNGSSSYLKYAACPGICYRPSNWHFTEVDTVGSTGWYVSLALGPGSVHIAYVTYNNPVQLRYATCAAPCTTPGNWTGTTIETAPLFGETQIVRDAAGVVHVVYQVREPNGGGALDLKYATCAANCTLPASWQIGTIAAGQLPSLTVAADGRLKLAYVDGAGDIRVASCMAGCTAAGAWQGASVVTSAGTVNDVALLVAPNGRQHLAYAEVPAGSTAGGRVRYKVCDSACEQLTHWRSLTIDSAQYRDPYYVAIAVDSAARVTVAHASSSHIRITEIKKPPQ